MTKTLIIYACIRGTYYRLNIKDGAIQLYVREEESEWVPTKHEDLERQIMAETLLFSSSSFGRLESPFPDMVFSYTLS
jgi:hypothetical protein